MILKCKAMHISFSLTYPDYSTYYCLYCDISLCW